MTNTRVAILLAATLIGCAPATPEQPDSTPGSRDTATTTVPDASPAIADSTAHARGFGPVRAGMTLAEAERALGAALISHQTEPCYFVVIDGRPDVAFMIIDGRIARLDVRRQATVKTAEGAGIGDSEARIHALYPGRVQVQPHEYTDGHYLVVTPESPADSTYRTIFETDGERVLRYRTGRLPEVSWVEGCS